MAVVKRKSIGDFQPNPLNPRIITDEQLAQLKAALLEFGDLSGFVVNRTTGRMVGGHQRVKALGDDAPVTVRTRYEQPTKQGTVAEGFVTYNGERYVYREVVWDEQRERAAMIAANKHGGDFEQDALADLLASLRSDGFNTTLTGFSEAELAKLLEGERSQPTPSGADGGDEVRIVQLELTVDTLPTFMERVRQLGEAFGIEDNVTSTVWRAVEECHAQHQHGNSKNRAL
jgi:hypothetical protein